mgnify:CR=1 FL=1
MNEYIIFKNYINDQFGGEDEIKWKSLKHNGVLFPKKYEKHNIPLLYNGKEIFLTKIQEEYATYYAKYIKTDYIKIKKFNKNFWNDWSKILGKNHEIQSLENCDFSNISNYIERLMSRPALQKAMKI